MASPPQEDRRAPMMTDHGAPAPPPSPAPPPTGHRKAKAVAFILLFALVVAVAVGGWRWYRSTRVTTDDAYVEGRIHMVSSRIPGTVVEILVRDNEPVKKGQLLLRIDREPYAVREQAAVAARESADADVKVAEAETVASRSDVVASRQEVAAAKARLPELEAAVGAAKSRLALSETKAVQATRDEDRAKSLFEQKVLPKEKFERAQTERSMAASQVEADRDQLKLAEAAILTQKAFILQKEASVGQREAAVSAREARKEQQGASRRQRDAALSEARLQTRYTEVVAPADGFITRKSVEPGQVVAAGQPLLAVASLEDVWIVANFKETEIGRLRPGQTVEIRVDSFGAKAFGGKIDSIMAGTGSAFSLLPPENATGNYVKVVQRVPVKIVLDEGADPEHALRIGLSVVPVVRVGG